MGKDDFVFFLVWIWVNDELIAKLLFVNEKDEEEQQQKMVE